MEEKIQIIKENRDAAIAALNSYLDKIYGLTDQYFTSDGKLKEGLTKDEKLEKFLLELREDASKYESVRRKIIDEDYNLSLKDINYVALAFTYVSATWQTIIKNLTKAIEETKPIVFKLMEKKN
ncbi:MAG: hypothetical protein ACI311_02385 [Bacilli bacterium]